MLLIIVLLAEDLNFKEAIKRVILCGICWTLGYGIMWASKWLLATLLINKDVVANAMDAIIYRSSNTMIGAEDFKRLDALKLAFSPYDVNVIKTIFGINIFCALVISIFNFKKYKPKQLLTSFINGIPILAISLISIVWYLVLSNHTIIHPFLSFRTALVIWFAVLVFIFKIVIDGKRNIIN